MLKTDYLIIGSGIAGLSLAVKLSERYPERDICIVTKGDRDESNTKYAQGGMAVVTDVLTDSFEKHIQDTFSAGAKEGDINVIRNIVEQAPDRLKELVEWGVNFDRSRKGELSLGREGGHSEHRIVHHKDITGLEIERSLLYYVENQKNIRVFQNAHAIDLITEHHLGKKVRRGDEIMCFGCYVFLSEEHRIEAIISSATVLATGGLGQVYQTTTNPIIATGDGIGMAYRAKAEVEGLELIQFHPTALYHTELKPSFLISEAVRGAGASVINAEGERFLLNYDKRGELAPRDIVSRAIDQEMKRTGVDHVYLDVTHMIDKFIEEFPNIYSKCQELFIDPTLQWIPIAPAAHYAMGGVKINLKGRTSLKNLYANGECASSGLHGSNRLASNSLLEAIAISHNIFLDLENVNSIDTSYMNIPDWYVQNSCEVRERALIEFIRSEIQQTMSRYVGIVRSNELLNRASTRLSVLYAEVLDLYKTSNMSSAIIELRNMIATSYLIVEQSRKRKHNSGAYFNSDLV
ncbi:MAG TPA: L-aspartate oxidase [Flavobacteriales bacterium]|jgi:L-aspartate oxidase|nr:L-aspartate oxidase [Flavobacteriales bacterium]